MATEKETPVETMESFKDALTSDGGDRKSRLRATENLKKWFKSPDQIFSKLKLDSLLQGARISLESNKLDKNFLYHYGASLIGFFGKDVTLDPEILHQLEYILRELKKEDESVTDALVGDLWTQFENESFFQSDSILDASKQILERAVLDWVDTPATLQLEFFSKISANSPKVFQTLTSALYEVLVKTRGHQKVLEVTETFIMSVKRACKKGGKNFLGLYPKGCGRLVTYLMIPPEIYSQENQEILNEILSLLLEMYTTSRKKALILLSHYPKWVSVFKVHLEQKQG